MKRKPSTEATAAWIRLMRIQSRVLDGVEQDLKKAGFPPLAWYDALFELSRAPAGELRPVELEKQMLLPQYSTSRLSDRLVDEGLAVRRECKVDKRGQFVEITESGRELQKKMWGAYSAAIEQHGGRGRFAAMILLTPFAFARTRANNPCSPRARSRCALIRKF